MSRLASGGSHVVFVENMGGVRSIRIKDAGRILRRLRRILSRGSRTTRRAPPRLDVVAPLLLPFPHSRLSRALNHVLIRRLAGSIRRLSGHEPIVFTFLPSREALELIARIRAPSSLLVYYCVADFSAVAQDTSAVVESEARLVRSADLVFVNSMRFAERFTPLNNRVLYFPGGVSLDRFDPGSAGETPTELLKLPRPLIGYVGGLHHHLDTGLLRALARAFPKGSIVAIGPVLADMSALSAEPNVHLLGARAWAELPPYLAALDVGLIPYVLSAYTATVYPTKLFEYLAMGCPVVSADLPEVRRLELPPYAVRIATDHSGFVEAVRAALSDTDASAAERRRELAREHDWAAIVDRMASVMVERADAKRAASAEGGVAAD
jgi:glycosyltransferase involved in cell wall biosynthesis